MDRYELINIDINRNRLTDAILIFIISTIVGYLMPNPFLYI